VIVRPWRCKSPQAAIAAAPTVKGIAAFAIRLDVPPNRRGSSPPTNAIPAATQNAQTSRSATSCRTTSGILSCVHAQDKALSG